MYNSTKGYLNNGCTLHLPRVSLGKVNLIYNFEVVPAVKLLFDVLLKFLPGTNRNRGPTRAEAAAKAKREPDETHLLIIYFLA